MYNNWPVQVPRRYGFYRAQILIVEEAAKAKKLTIAAATYLTHHWSD